MEGEKTCEEQAFETRKGLKVRKMTGEEEKRIREFKERIGYEEPVTREDLKRALESAMRDRGLYAYFIWKVIQELQPEADADGILAEAMHRYGLYKSKAMGQVENAMDGMLNQSSKNGMIVFEQEFAALSEDYAEKHIHNCPLINAFREVGATQEEITKLCKTLLAPSDFGILEPFADKVELSFPKTLSDEDVCIMCVRRRS